MIFLYYNYYKTKILRIFKLFLNCLANYKKSYKLSKKPFTFATNLKLTKYLIFWYEKVAIFTGQKLKK